MLVMWIPYIATTLILGKDQEYAKNSHTALFVITQNWKQPLLFTVGQQRICTLL